MKFDVICGNPPYNNDNTGKKGGARNDLLWPKFVTKSLELLKEGGYLCMVHPQIWRKPEHNMWNAIASNQIHYMHIMNEDEGKKTFGVSVKCDWYVLQKTAVTKAFSVRTENGKVQQIDTRDFNFIPNSMIDIVTRIIAKGNDDKCNVLYDCQYHTQNKEKMSAEKDNTFKYPCIYSINSLENGGVAYYYSATKDDNNFGIAKVILGEGRFARPLNDYKGEFGTTQCSFGIRISSKKEGDLIAAAINTPKFQEIIKATKWSGFRIDFRMFRYFKRDFWKQFVDSNGNELTVNL